MTKQFSHVFFVSDIYCYDDECKADLREETEVVTVANREQ